MNLSLDTPISKYTKIPKAYATKLKKLKISTLGNLIYHIPHRYDDFSNIVKIIDLQPDTEVTIRAKINNINVRRSFRRKNFTIIEAVAEDDTGAVKIVWFNQPFITRTLRKDVTVFLSGKVKLDNEGLVLSSPTFELTRGGDTSDQVHTARMVPIYHETAGVSSKWLRYVIKPILNEIISQEEEFLPPQIRKDLDLPSIDEALLNIHYPKDEEEAKKAKERLTFQEIFLIQLNFLRVKLSREKEKSYRITFKKEETKNFVEKLPFDLTKDQRIASWEILQSMENVDNGPMNRLLEGDVGSGKTVVAAIASLNVYNNKFQTAIIAPTEILAKQHFETFKKFLGGIFPIILLTSSQVNTSPLTPLLIKKRGIGDIPSLLPGEKIYRIHNQKWLKETRRRLRREQTKAEEILWNHLRNKKIKDYKFKRQHSVENFILDFYCPSKKIAIEVDGPYHESKESKEYDSERTKFLNKYGITFIRYSNDDVLNNTDKIVKSLIKELKKSPPAVPLLVKEGSGEVTKKNIYKIINSGFPAIYIGTHALLQKNIEFKNLALLIIDEQHRFGVAQRAHLTKAKKRPHLLTMSATPIPRTLALSVYGDLEISRLKTKPAGRKEIQTRIVSPANREKAYDFIRQQINDGRQAFVICPLIEDSEKLEVKSVTQEFEKLDKKVFRDTPIGMLHGKLKPKEKDKVMKEFSEGKTKILVSTSVVEVGVDVPNSTIVIIEDADRFGLAQIHQFRGRVGRSDYQSYCFLFTESTAAKSHRRLKALEKTSNGFELAEIDLQLRGPGEFCGTHQSGLPDLTMENLNNSKLINNARDWARKILEESPDLKKYPKLERQFQKFKKDIHLE